MNTNQQLLDSIKKALGDSTNSLQKTITTSTGLVNFDLQAPAKNLYPVITPIRNRLPRVQGRGGIATNWRQVSAIVGSGVKSMPWVPEGQRSGRMSYVTANKSAPYVTLGEEDTVTEEAINAAAGFEDVQSTMTMRLLQQTMIKEESAIIGGNASLALGTPAAPTLTASGTGATLPALTYSVIVVALTLEGYLAASLSTGVVQAQAIVGADGKSYTVNGGSSNKSVAATQAATLGQTLFASTAVVNGAVAYAWFTGAAGSEKLEAITTINSVSFAGPLLGTGQPATAITADCSRNASLAFDGIFSTAFNSGTAYIKSMATGVSGTGTPLTVGNRRNVVEIDTMLKSMWDNYRLSPTVIYVNSQELQNITNKVMNNTSNPIYYAADQGNPYAVVANGVVTGYFNPFTTAGNNVVIPIMLHPNIPAGTILAWAENLPAQYQSSEVPNTAEIHVRKDYVQTFWPQVTRSRDTGVYVEEGFACYAPFGIGMIVNIGNG
jgi:hypothetical protein